jgi:hypothetical protein
MYQEPIDKVGQLIDNLKSMPTLSNAHVTIYIKDSEANNTHVKHSASWRQPQLFKDSCICDNQRTVILITIHGSSLNYTIIYDVNAKLRLHADTSRDQA